MNPVNTQSSRALSAGTILPHNYIIEKVLGEGGFGITYSGYSHFTEEKIAIKEYFPGEIAYRHFESEDSFSVVPYAEAKKTFEKGRLHFRKEASILKEFHDLNSIVSVRDVIEANGTVYLVMDYIDGITLKQYVKENGTLSFEELLPLMTPVIQALIQIHQKGLIHRDISPENIMIGTDNQLHLIDFGAASFENGHIDKTMTVILKSGYAPPEQYLSDGKQGAWTDIYALCATMYFLLTGFAPTESLRRIQKDDLLPLAANANISSWQAAAIEKGMNLSAADRYQNMEALYQSFIIPPMEMDSKIAAYKAASIENNKTIMGSTPIKHKKHTNPFSKIRYAIPMFFVVFLLAGGLGGTYYWQSKHNSSVKDTTNLQPVTTQQPTSEAASKTTTESSVYTMLDLTDKTLEAATLSLGRLDSAIAIQTTYVNDDTHAVNTIIEQSIQAGTSFTKGSIKNILLTVSNGPATTTEANTSAPTQKNKTSDKQNPGYIVTPSDDDYTNLQLN